MVSYQGVANKRAFFCWEIGKEKRSFSIKVLVELFQKLMGCGAKPDRNRHGLPVYSLSRPVGLSKHCGLIDEEREVFWLFGRSKLRGDIK